MHTDLVKNKYPVPVNADEALRSLDNDGSGQVSFNEFVVVSPRERVVSNFFDWIVDVWSFKMVVAVPPPLKNERNAFCFHYNCTLENRKTCKSTC